MVRRVRSVDRRHQQPDFGEKLGIATMRSADSLYPWGESHVCGWGVVSLPFFWMDWGLCAIRWVTIPAQALAVKFAEHLRGTPMESTEEACGFGIKAAFYLTQLFSNRGFEVFRKYCSNFTRNGLNSNNLFFTACCNHFFFWPTQRQTLCRSCCRWQWNNTANSKGL